MGMLRALQEFRHLLAFAQRHVGFLPVRSAAGVAPLSLLLAVRDAGSNGVDFRAEERFDGPPDLHLVGAERHLKHNRPAVLARSEERRVGKEWRSRRSRYHDE